MEKKTRAPRKPKAKIEAHLTEEQVMVGSPEVMAIEKLDVSPSEMHINPQPKTEDVELFYSYKCIECGNIQKVRQCKRCGGNITRRL